MTDDNLVLVAGTYGDADAATEDFKALKKVNPQATTCRAA